MNLEALLLKLLEYKNNNDIEELKVDLKRICDPWFGNDQIDNGYIDYLYKHYNNEIQYIYNSLISSGNTINDMQISRKENIRNYLIKIAIIRICNKEAIQYEIHRMNDANYCAELLNTVKNK